MYLIRAGHLLPYRSRIVPTSLDSLASYLSKTTEFERNLPAGVASNKSSRLKLNGLSNLEFLFYISHSLPFYLDARISLVVYLTPFTCLFPLVVYAASFAV